MIFNYRDMAFERRNGENFDVLYMSFLDYNMNIREITITWSTVGRSSVWLAQFSGHTTEYSGELGDILEKVYKKYTNDRYIPVKSIDL